MVHPFRFLAFVLFLVSCSGPGEGHGSSAAPLTECPCDGAGTCVEGVDVFDGQGAVDWPAARDAGIVFALIKATQGTYDTQSTFAFNWAAARDAGVRRSAYHFFDPGEDGAEQARHLLEVVGAGDPGELPITLDVECPDGDPDCLGVPGRAPDASATEVMAGVSAFLAAVEGATGVRPALYTFASYFALLGADAGALAAYPLDLAYPTSDGCFPVPAPWSRATFWQYSWTGAVPGIGPAVDRERFLGSLAALDSLGAAREAGAAIAMVTASGASCDAREANMPVLR